MTPLELARQTLIQLASSKSAPTPENFKRVYDEMAGIESINHADLLNKSLLKVLYDLGERSPRFLAATNEINMLIDANDGAKLEIRLRDLLMSEHEEVEELDWARLMRHLLTQFEANHPHLTQSKKREGLDRLLINSAHHPNQMGKQIHALITSWGEGQPANQTAEISLEKEKRVDQPLSAQLISQTHSVQNCAKSNHGDLNLAWRDMLIRTIKLLVLPQFADVPAAIRRIEKIILQAEQSQTSEEIDELNNALKSTLLRTEMQQDSKNRIQDGLIQILRLMVSSMGELTIEDKWLQGQLAIVQEIIAKPLNIDSVYNAESSLKDLLIKQASIKPEMVAAKDTIKNMVSSFVNSLADITLNTGIYQEKLKSYQVQISGTEDVSQLNGILHNLVGDIGVMSYEAQKSQNEFKETQKKVEEAEKQINELTVKLECISEAAQQDFLTGALNRRGMDEAIEIEFNRADRHNTPISLAMIDIDHFKKINDTLGHAAGDEALSHLAKVVKSSLRSTDVLARYGGEEFVVLLPGSKQDDAINVVEGLQRQLTKQYFLNNHERILITFSAGVVERMPGENIDNVLPRADAAMYVAKQTGRNRVVGAASIELIATLGDEVMTGT